MCKPIFGGDIRNIRILLLLALLTVGFGQDPPEEFQYEQSTFQAFYYFHIVLINDVEVEADDWVGVFKGDVCVGSRKWDTSQCGSGVCDAPAMGWCDYINDNNCSYPPAPYDEYLLPGDIPTFKIYDASADIYYDATPSEEHAWFNFGFLNGELLQANVSISGCTDPEACNYDESANDDDDSCEYEVDCAGTCGGDLEPDCCGVCGGDNSQCSNCCGSPFYEDCSDDCAIDLNGVCCYELEVDACGECNGDGTDCNDDGIPDDCEEVYTAGLEEGILIGAQSGDVNGDGELNIIDIVIFIEMILNP